MLTRNESHTNFLNLIFEYIIHMIRMLAFQLWDLCLNLIGDLSGDFLITGWRENPRVWHCREAPENNTMSWPKPCQWNWIDKNCLKTIDSWATSDGFIEQVYWPCTTMDHAKLCTHFEKLQVRFAQHSCSINHGLALWMLN